MFGAVDVKLRTAGPLPPQQGPPTALHPAAGGGGHPLRLLRTGGRAGGNCRLLFPAKHLYYYKGESV